MIGNILKITVTLFISFLIGFIFGFIFGVFLGGIPTLFFREIINSNQAVLLSITLSLILGGLLGFLALQMANNIFDARDKPLFGVLIGIAVGFIVVFFVEGVIYSPDPETFTNRMHILPIIYSSRVGTYIGAFSFPIIGATRLLRDIFAYIIESRRTKAL
jgi:CDP-diglyceride synthetase